METTPTQTSLRPQPNQNNHVSAKEHLVQLSHPEGVLKITPMSNGFSLETVREGNTIPINGFRFEGRSLGQKADRAIRRLVDDGLGHYRFSVDSGENLIIKKRSRHQSSPSHPSVPSRVATCEPPTVSRSSRVEHSNVDISEEVMTVGQPEAPVSDTKLAQMESQERHVDSRAEVKRRRYIRKYKIAGFALGAAVSLGICLGIPGAVAAIPLMLAIFGTIGFFTGWGIGRHAASTMPF